MLQTHQQLPLGHATKLLEVKYPIVFAPTGVLERVTLAKWNWNKRGIDAADDPKGELSDIASKRDPRFLQAGSPIVPIACQRGPCPEGVGSTTAAATTFATSVSGR